MSNVFDLLNGSNSTSCSGASAITSEDMRASIKTAIAIIGEPKIDFPTIVGPPAILRDFEETMKLKHREMISEMPMAKLVSSPYCYKREQVKFPRSKKKRNINAKNRYTHQEWFSFNL